MDPNEVKSTLSNLAFGNVMAAAARDYQKIQIPACLYKQGNVMPKLDGFKSYCLIVGKHRIICLAKRDCTSRHISEELLAQDKPHASTSVNQEVDLDELMDDPELEKLHADRIAALKKEAEKRQALKKQGHGEYREITEGDFLGEVTGSEKVICHFYHREFYRCKIMDKHLKSLAPRHVSTKFIKLDAENAPFFVAKLAIKTLPCAVLFRNGVATDRLVGFQDLGGKDDFSTKALESLLIRKGIISKSKGDEEDEGDDYTENKCRTVRSSAEINSDSD